MVFAAKPSRAQDDAPPGTARLGYLTGNVSVQPNGVDSWEQAQINMPMGSGDRVYTDPGAEGVLDAAQVRAYFSPGSDLTLTNLNDQGVELGLAQGSTSIFSDGFPDGQSLFVSTPNGGITVAGRAGFRVDVYPDQQSTVITNYNNWDDLQLNGAGGFALTLGRGQSVQLSGTNPVYSQYLEPAPFDDFAHWSGGLESHRNNSISAQYVSTEMAGYEELDNSGDWQPQSDYGPIWFPRVDPGWAPYHNGHWVNRPFYGWTWVADESWGAAPFHYGRWVQLGGRWGWIPGPREDHPIWSPAQVVFAGGINVGGVGLSVWFPLGPGEAYRPWYPASPEYINRINITNIRESRVVHVQNTYVNVVNVTNVTYVNRTSVTAMRQDDFASGRNARATAVKVDPGVTNHIQIARPEAKPPAQPVIVHPIARPAAVQAARPVLINHQGQQAPAAPNARPVAVPVRATPPAPPRPIPGRATIGAPAVGGKPVPPPARTPAAPVAPARPSAPMQAAPERTPPVRPTMPAPKAPATDEPARPQPSPQTRPQPAPSAERPVPPAVERPVTPPPPPAARPAPPAKPAPRNADEKKKDEKNPPKKPE